MSIKQSFWSKERGTAIVDAELPVYGNISKANGNLDVALDVYQNVDRGTGNELMAHSYGLRWHRYHDGVVTVQM